MHSKIFNPSLRPFFALKKKIEAQNNNLLEGRKKWRKGGEVVHKGAGTFVLTSYADKLHQTLLVATRLGWQRTKICICVAMLSRSLQIGEFDSATLCIAWCKKTFAGHLYCRLYYTLGSFPSNLWHNKIARQIFSYERANLKKLSCFQFIFCKMILSNWFALSKLWWNCDWAETGCVLELLLSPLRPAPLRSVILCKRKWFQTFQFLVPKIDKASEKCDA